MIDSGGIWQPSINHSCDSTCTVPVNKKFTFDDRRTIVLRCKRLRFVPDEMVRERKWNGMERSESGV